MKRVFGLFEAVFDILYLVVAIIIGLTLLLSTPYSFLRILAGIMALVLALGDAFHLIPRIYVIITDKEEQMTRLLGRGKQIASITMTIFYVILWHVGVILFSPVNIIFWTYAVYSLAIIRIILCLFPQNKWEKRYSPIKWGVWRNIPFFIQGMLVAGLFFAFKDVLPFIGTVWFAIILSFLFYIPVVIWSNKNPKLGMLMLPKTCTYLWLLIMFISL